jgi:methyl-accepting chemotaxis protein
MNNAKGGIFGGLFRNAEQEAQIAQLQARLAEADRIRAELEQRAADADRRAAAAAPAESRLQSLERSHAMAELEPDGRITRVNEAFAKLFGYGASELAGQRLSMLVSPDNADMDGNRAYRIALERGEAAGGHQLRTRKDGSEVWIFAAATPVRDASGRVTGLIELCVDVHDYSAGYVETQRELDIRTRIMDITSIVSVGDRKGDIVTINEKFLEVSKYSRDELIGAGHNKTRHPDMPKEVFKEMWATIGRGGIFRGVVKNRAKDGTPYYVDAVIAPYVGKNGKPERYLGVRYDITESELQRHTMNGVWDAINKAYCVIEFDLKGNITHANDNFLKAVGYNSDEVDGKHHGMFVPKEFADTKDYREFWDMIARGERYGGQFKYLGKGGKEVWLDATYNPICDEMGRPFKIIEFAADITNQRNAEQLEAAVKESQAVINAAQEGDLTGRVPLEGKTGSIAKLCQGINAILDSMAGVVGLVKESTEAINTAAREIAAGNSDLSGRTEEQASSLQETAASMEQLNGTVKQNSESAKLANHLAIGASDVASKGGEAVTEVVRTMETISESSRKIADIISVIDGIAFQTNILALNAAVEAARAGEQGRGFAVVASEVRNLAQRSAAAAKEIKTLISDSVDKVNLGSRLVSDAGHTMEEIVDSVRKVTEIMGEIATASAEQSSGIQQVSEAVSQMDDVTQQNAALVEEAAAAAESLQGQAESLYSAVAHFQVSGQSLAHSQTSGGRPVASGARSAGKPAGSSAPRRTVASLPAGAEADWEEF